MILRSSEDVESVFRGDTRKGCCCRKEERRSVTKRAFQAENGRRTQNLRDETGDEEENGRKEEYNCT